MLGSKSSIPIASYGSSCEDHETEKRYVARHSRPTRLEDAFAGSDARLGDHTSNSGDLRRGAAGGGGFPVSSTASHGAGGLDRGRVGLEREQSASALLPTHGGRSQATGSRRTELEAAHGGGCASSGFRGRKRLRGKC